MSTDSQLSGRTTTQGRPILQLFSARPDQDLHQPLLAPGPIPPGRGRWRLTLHKRSFYDDQPRPMIGELLNARARTLTQVLNSPAQLTFGLDGRGPEAPLVSELRTEVWAWRWDEDTGGDVLMFAGLVTNSQDDIDEDSHTVGFVVWDWLKMLERRFITAPRAWYPPTPPDPNVPDDPGKPGGISGDSVNQDELCTKLVLYAKGMTATDGTTLGAGPYLPLGGCQFCDPAGAYRQTGAGVPDRQRTYLGSQQIGTAFDDLSKCVNGFDYDCVPGPASKFSYGDIVRVFFPVQGVDRPEISLIYGQNIARVSRAVASNTYSNFVRLLGNIQGSLPQGVTAGPLDQLYAEKWSPEATDVHGVHGPWGGIGLFAEAANASDVTIQEHLDEQAQGVLDSDTVLDASYTLALTPGTYTMGAPNMGDTLPLVVNSGRLTVNTRVRVVGITYNIDDDGFEDVTLVVGRRPPNLTAMLTQADRDVAALARR